VMTDSEQFRRYVTSTAFSLSLSGNMVAALDHIDRWGYVYGSRGRFHEFGRLIWSAKGGLIRRGLILWGDQAAAAGSPAGPVLTEAGQLVLQLCRLAGLADARTEEEMTA